MFVGIEDVSLTFDFRPHHEWLDTAGDPVKTEGIGTVKLSLRGNHRRTIVLKNVYYAPRVGMNLVSVTKLLRDRYSVAAHSHGALLQRGSRTIGKADLTEDDLLVLRCIASRRSFAYVNLARCSTHRDGDAVEPPAAPQDVGPQESSDDVPRRTLTSELNLGEATTLEEEAAGGH